MTIARRHADIEVRRGSEAALNITCRSVLSRGRRNVRKLEERQRLLLAHPGRLLTNLLHSPEPCRFMLSAGGMHLIAEASMAQGDFFRSSRPALNAKRIIGPKQPFKPKRTICRRSSHGARTSRGCLCRAEPARSGALQAVPCCALLRWRLDRRLRRSADRAGVLALRAARCLAVCALAGRAGQPMGRP